MARFAAVSFLLVCILPAAIHATSPRLEEVQAPPPIATRQSGGDKYFIERYYGDPFIFPNCSAKYTESRFPLEKCTFDGTDSNIKFCANGVLTMHLYERIRNCEGNYTVSTAHTKTCHTRSYGHWMFNQYMYLCP